jgi:hypothetical protein
LAKALAVPRRRRMGWKCMVMKKRVEGLVVADGSTR